MYRRETLVILQHYLDLARETRHHDGVGCQSADDSSLDRHLDAQTIRQTTPRVHQVDPFKPLIEERLRLYPALSSVRLLAECRAAGYVGGSTQLRDLWRPCDPRPLWEVPRYGERFSRAV